MSFLIDMVNALRAVETPSAHHPESNQFSHTMQVTFAAMAETDDRDLIAAAILHDVGKAVEVHNHDKIGCDMIRTFVSAKTLWIVENHIRIIFYMDGTMGAKKAAQLDQHPWFRDLCRFRRWDVSGRNPSFNWKDEKQQERFLEVMRAHLIDKT